MNPASPIPALARVARPLALALVALPGALAAQDPCPSASAVDAEAGWAAYQSEDMSSARARFQAAVARCANDHYARTGLGYVALRDGDTAHAAELFDAVIEAEPNNVDALVGLGLAAWRAGNLDAAEERFGRVVMLQPEHPTAIEYLERLDEARRAPSDATDPSDPADRAWLAGDTEAALRLYAERLDANPLDGLALLRTGLIRAWDGQHAAAMELLDLLVDLEPHNMDARLARARVRAWSGDIPAAEAEVRSVLDEQPQNVDALATLALFQSWSGQLDEALAGYDEILSIAPEHATGRMQQAQAMAWAESYGPSLAAFESLVARDPGDVEARVGLATALAYSGDYEGALAQHDAILARVPGEMRALTGRSRVLGWAGRLVESERAAVRAIEADRSDARAWAMLGQVYRWQGRDAAAKETFEIATGFAPTDPEIRDQLRSVNLALAPLARPTFTAERDSDGNRMLTTSLVASWHPLPRLEVRASGYHRRLEQPIGLGRLERTANGVQVRGAYQASPGWVLTGGFGGSMTDGLDDPRFLSFEAGVRTPDRHGLGAGVSLTSTGLDATAALAERGVRASELLFTGRWLPGAPWRLDGSVGVGRYEGTSTNGRRSAAFVVNRRIGPAFSVGTSWRGFSFENNLSDGYFDPDFYGVAELTGQWTYRGLPWNLLVELAPGLQQVGSEGGRSASFRSNGRVGYRVAPGREVSLSVGYSTAGLTQFATGESGYDYTAFILGFNWVF